MFYLIKIHIHFSYKGVTILHCNVCFITNLRVHWWIVIELQIKSTASSAQQGFRKHFSLCAHKLRGWPRALRWVPGTPGPSHGEGSLPEALALGSMLSAVLQSVRLSGLRAGGLPSDGGWVPKHSTVLSPDHRGGGGCGERTRAVVELSMAVLIPWLLGLGMILIFFLKICPQLKTQKA